MSWPGAVRTATGGILRHKVQAVAIGLVVLVSTAALVVVGYGDSLPPGAVTGAASWLAAQGQATGNGAVMEPFVVAFALIGLAMAVLIVGNVVSGAVVASYTRIGVLKCVGLSPAQVVVAYLSRVGWPALAGCLAGVVAGNLLMVIGWRRGRRGRLGPDGVRPAPRAGPVSGTPRWCRSRSCALRCACVR
jgi:hypothetical protein